MSTGFKLESDEVFITALENSRPAVWRVAQWLGDMGYDVQVPASKVRPSVGQRAEYSDHGDLFITGLRHPAWVRVEVKRRGSCEFSADGHCQYQTIFVDSAYRWDNANPKPLAYVFLNDSMTAAAIVKGTTAPRWIKQRRFDRRKGDWRTFYECPVSEVQFISI